jgi:hypothetical protein
MSQILVSSLVGGKALMQSPPFVDAAVFRNRQLKRMAPKAAYPRCTTCAKSEAVR